MVRRITVPATITSTASNGTITFSGGGGGGGWTQVGTITSGGGAGWGGTVRPVERKVPSLFEKDIINISALLNGEEAKWSDSTLLAPHPNRGGEGKIRWTNLYTRSGGYAFMVKSSTDGPHFLNLDHADLVRADSLRRYREQALEIAKSQSKELRLLPIGLTALRNGPAQTAPQRAGVRAVCVEGLEAVVEIPDGEGNPQWYLSGYDEQEYPPLYFLCRLPHKVETVAAARDALMPDSVRTAIAEGTRVERQGDLFAIRCQLTDEQIIEAGGAIHDYQTLAALRVNGLRDLPTRDDYRLYGTVHTASRIARLPNGLELATGKLIHNPVLSGDFRAPDHQDRWLDGGWWFIIPNTVPKQKGSARRRLW